MKRKKPSRRRWVAALLLILFLACAALAGKMLFDASLVHVMRGTVCLEDLPPAFEGKTILFVSDIDLGGINTPKRAAEVFHRLQELSPDMLLLGGDYTAPTLADLLNQRPVTEYTANQAQIWRDFFYYISDFQAPLGRYAIAAPDDRLLTDLKQGMTDTGVVPLDSQRVRIDLGSDHLWLVGVGNDSGKVARIGSEFLRSECVLALCYSPNQFPMLMTSEAGDSGHWVDMTLAGHTHGGQIRLLGRNVLTLDSLETQYLHGWNRETGVPMLTTSGLGCEGANLRLGSQAEVWLITLTNVRGE